MSIKKHSGLSIIFFGALIIVALVVVGLNLLPTEKGELPPSGGEVKPSIEDKKDEEKKPTETKKPVAEAKKEEEEKTEEAEEEIAYTPMPYLAPVWYPSAPATPATPATEPEEDPEEEPEETTTPVVTIFHTDQHGLRFFLESDSLIANLATNIIALANGASAKISHSAETSGVYDSVSITSSAPSVLTITDGIITTIATGSSEITLTACIDATTCETPHSFRLDVIDREVNLPGISLDPNIKDPDIAFTDYSIEVDNLYLTENGFTLDYGTEFTMHAANDTGEVEAVTWSSGDESVFEQSTEGANVFTAVEPANPTIPSTPASATITATDENGKEATFVFASDTFEMAV